MAGLEPVHWPDTDSYFAIDFLGGATRLWTVPLEYQALPADWLRVVGQTALGILGWGVLAFAAARACLLRPVGLGAAGAVLLLGLTPQVTEWDLTLLAESTTLSLTALGAGLGLLVAERQGGRAVIAALAAVLVLWTFARHANAIVLGLAFPVVAGLAIWRLPRRQAAVVTAGLALLSAWALYSVSREDQIWRGNAQHMLFKRLLQEPEARSHFEERGLVITPALDRQTRHFARPGNSAFDDPPYRRWLDDRFRSAYASYLVTNAPSVLTDPLRELPRRVSESAPYATPRGVLPEPAADVLWADDGRRLWLFLLAAGAVGLWLWSLRRAPPRGAEIVPWALILLALAWVEVAWNSSTEELPRLFLPAGASLRIGLILLAAFALDRTLSTRAPIAQLDRATPS